MSRRKLLLADDSITIQKVVNLTFANEDIEVISVGDGDAAMRKFAEDKPDLVMADVNMPGPDGYRICEMIKQDAETRNIPVVLLVGSFEPFDEEKARRVGANDFLTKPFQSIHQLVNKVSDLLSRANGESEVDSFADTLENIPKSDDATANENLNEEAANGETIQTEQIGSLPVNDLQKISVAPIDSSAFEDTDIDSIQPPYDFSDSIQAAKQSEKQNSTRKTENNFSAESFDENENNFEPENALSEQLNDELEQILKNKEGADEVPEDFSVFALDDLDLLELPQSKRGAAKLNGQYETREPENVAAQNHTELFAAQTSNLSPEFVEAVAERVVERLSNEVITKIVRETIAQMNEEK